MKLRPSGLQKTAIIAAITLSTIGIVAFAQSAPPPQGPQGGPPMNQAGKAGGWHGMMGPHNDRESGRMGHMGRHMDHGLAIEQIAHLKTSLKLTAQQAALWDKAEKAMTPPTPEARTKMREQMKARHDQTLAALADPKFDPRKFSAEMEKQQADLQAEHKARMTTVREAWFSVYDSLDAGQRGQVREFLRERFDRGGRMSGAKEHHRAGMPGGPRDGQNHPMGNMPPPPPAK